MAEKKANQLKGMLGKSTKSQAAVTGGEIAGAAPAETPMVIKGAPYRTGHQETAIELPTRAGELSTSLQDKARNYLAARRRTGEALLDAARWMSEARAEAQHGQWLIFLDVTTTTPDTAERLVNIYPTGSAPQQQDFLRVLAHR